MRTIKQTIVEKLGAKPCTFRGKMIVIECEGTDFVHPIARVNNHLDSCRVVKIVRISENGELIEDDLDNPENEPWFLIKGEYRFVARYFIVNGADEYLPALCSPGDPSNCSLMNPQVYKEEFKIENHDVEADQTGLHDTKFIYEWDMFSKLDLYLVKEAISAYTRGAY